MESARVLKCKTRSNSSSRYEPHLGFIGDKQVRVPNYLFRSKGGGAHFHARGIARALLSRSIEEHFRTSHRLTRFIRDRGLTFQKSGKDGRYEIFTVPVTNSVVPLPKSTFLSIEHAARVLILSLRKVLQSIYGASSIRESAFFEFLSSDARGIFLDATESSPHYLPQLHHPVMRDYPFMDQVGLDLVLVEEYLREGREIPFRLLELNAGSPSGASNNMSILEGLYQEDPGLLESMGPVFQNDHFRILRETYESLGRGWTGRLDGIPVLLPPGGANGASPEIHQIAYRSGLPYCEAGQLYPDEEGWIRIRTLDGVNPVVTAIHSRVNSDSVLYDPARGVYLRDPDTGARLHCLDTLKPWSSGRPEYLRDGKGRPVPLESEYAVNGAIAAIHSRKLYLGGLNRLLDNKMILSTLMENAPRFARAEIERHGITLDGVSIRPPEGLPPVHESVRRIEERPEEWVVKAPNLSGGTGVHILLSMDEASRRKVLSEVRRNPGAFAYQRIVRIARIPVAVRKSSGYRFANLAADIRMWVFFGGEGSIPRLTHNALVRFAPEEKGPMSSMVNTSKGGGYAPFVVVDDAGSPDAVEPGELAVPPEPLEPACGIPAFAGAQILRMSDWVAELRGMLRSSDVPPEGIFDRVEALRLQMREVASFFDPECVVSIQSLRSMAERGFARESRIARSGMLESLQAEWVSALPPLAESLDREWAEAVEGLCSLDPEAVVRGVSARETIAERRRLRCLIRLCRKRSQSEPGRRREWGRLERIARGFARIDWAPSPPDSFLRRRMERELARFSARSCEALRRSGAGELGDSFVNPVSTIQPFQEGGGSGLAAEGARHATEWEWIHGKSLMDSEEIDPGVQRLRWEWLDTLAGIRMTPREEWDERLREARIRHFRKHPELAALQQLIELGRNSDPHVLEPLMRVLPYASWNLDHYARRHRMGVREVLRMLCRFGKGTGASSASGECFIRKKSPHGLLSRGECFIRIAEGQSPFTQAYTLGHELVHAAQLEGLMSLEREAIAAGPLEFASFLRDYGVYHALSVQVIEAGGAGELELRTPVHGLPDRMVSQFFSTVISELRGGLGESGTRYQKVLRKYGGWLGFMMPVTPAVRVKALREVFPALENLKNLLFASECGLELPVDPVSASLPTANRVERRIYREKLLSHGRVPRPGGDLLRTVASFQLHGVRFRTEGDLPPSVSAGITVIRPGQAYNQTEQQ